MISVTSPERSPRGSKVHVDAMRRLDEAREQQNDARAALEAAGGTADEQDAEEDLASAREQTAAREAWLVWLERGF